jgi:hypothetical protein
MSIGKTQRARTLATALLVLALTFFGCIFLYLIGIDALEGRSDFLFFADSETYHSAARGDLSGIDALSDSIAVSANYLGPLVLLRLAGQNYYAVLFINCCLFFLSAVSIARSLRIDPLRFSLLLLANPLTVSSLLSVNKEIISLVFLALLLRALARRAWLPLLAATLIALLVRWQLVVFVVTLCVLALPLNPVRRWRGITLAALLLALSVLYMALASVFEPIRAVLDISAANYEGSGLMELLQGWQDAGLYWLAFPIKAGHLLFGMGLHFERLLAPTDIYNDVWQLLHSTMTLALFIALLKTRRLSFSNDLVFISIIYMAVFALTPVYAPRYFLPVYFLWAAALTPSFKPVALLPDSASKPQPRVATNTPIRMPA